MARADVLREYLKNQAIPEEEKDLEDKAIEVGGKILEKAEPILRTLDYPAGLVRGTIAGGLEAATGKDDIVDIKDVIKGKAPSSAEIMEKVGVPEGKSLSDILPGMYSETGKGLALKKGGLFDPTARGAAGFAADIALDPLALLAGKGTKAVVKEAVQDPTAFRKELLSKLSDERGSLDFNVKLPKNLPLDLRQLTQVLPGIYSKAEKTILEKMGDSARPEQLYYVTDKGPSGLLVSAGVKPEEIKFLKIPEFLEGKKTVSKDELLSHIRKNLPNLSLKQFNQFSSMGIHPLGGDYTFKGVQYHVPIPDNILKEAEQFLDQYMSKIDRLKTSDPEIIEDLLKHLQEKNVFIEDIADKKLDELLKKYNIGETYKKDNKRYLNLFSDTLHYGDAPNILGHYRSQLSSKGIMNALQNFDSILFKDALEKNLQKQKQLNKEINNIRSKLDKAYKVSTSPETDENIKLLSENIDKKFKELEELENTHSTLLEEIEKLESNEEHLSYIMNEAQTQPHHQGTKYGYLTDEDKLLLPKLKDDVFLKQQEYNNISNEYEIAKNKFEEYKQRYGVSDKNRDEIFERHEARLTELPENDGLTSGEIRMKVFDDPEYKNDTTQHYRKLYKLYDIPEYKQLNNYINDLSRKKSDISAALSEAQFRLSELDKKMPDFPFKGDAIYELLTKLMAYDAADQGAKSIIVPTGKTQIKKWPSSRQGSGIGEIEVVKNPETGNLEITPRDTASRMKGISSRTIKSAGETKPTFKPGDWMPRTEQIPLTLGNLDVWLDKPELKKVKQILQSRGLKKVDELSPGWAIQKKKPAVKIGPQEAPIDASGVTIKAKPHGDLMTLGGRRFRKIYDELIPKLLSKIAEPYGVKPRQEVIETIPGTTMKSTDYVLGPDTILEMTPKMRNNILKYGFPLWMIPFIMNQEESEETEAFPKFEKIKKKMKG